MRGPLRMRLIPWIDVTEAKTSGEGSLRLTLVTNRDSVKLDASSVGPSWFCLLASIHQHLARLGRADGMVLPENALSIWREVPEDVPSEVEWNAGSSRAAIFLGVFGVLMFGGCGWLIVSSLREGKIGMVIMAGFALVAWWALFQGLLAPSVCRSPLQVGVRRDGLEARLPFRNVRISWSDVAAAWWFNDNLIVRAGNSRREIWFGYRLGDRESEQRMMCLIRHLRSAGGGQAIPLPMLVSVDSKCLRQPAYSSQRQGIVRRAFLEALDKPIRTLLNRLYGLQAASIFVGLALGAAFVFAEVPGRLSKLIFAAPGTRHFVPSAAIIVGVPIMFGAMCIVAICAEKLTLKLAGEHVERWRELCRVGTSEKMERAGKAIVYVFACLGLLGFLSVPLFVCSYTRVTDSGIAMNRPFAFKERLYRWVEIREVVDYRRIAMNHGRTVARDTYTVRFSDGTDWTIGDSTTVGRQIAETEGALALIAKKSGKQMRVEYEGD